jgi:hypothetical protein
MSYALFFTPAALPVAVLTLIVVPILSLAVVIIGLIAIAAVAAKVAAKGVTASFQLASSNRRHRRGVPSDPKRSLSCS